MSSRLTPTPGSLSRIAAWLFAIVAALALAAWGVSVIWTMFFMSQFADSIGMKAGMAFWSWPSDALRQQLSVEHSLPLAKQWTWYSSPRQTPLEWSGIWDAHPSGRTLVCIPLWPIVLLGSIAAPLCWRRWRRLSRIGCCVNCGYSFMNLPAASPCPECGTPRATSPTVASIAEMDLVP